MLYLHDIELTVCSPGSQWEPVENLAQIVERLGVSFFGICEEFIYA